eukprot:6445349-Pyramimonas_sp.AAC.1
MAGDTVERNPDLVVAYTSSSNHYVMTALALNSYLESDADITSQKVLNFLRELGQKVGLDRLPLAAFPAEAAEERVRDDVDAIVGDDDVAAVSMESMGDEGQYILEQINLPGEPKHEEQRRNAWLQIPLDTMIAIRRLQDSLLLRISRVSSDYIDAAENYRCESCEHHNALAQTHKVALHRKFCFNHEIGIGCLQ